MTQVIHYAVWPEGNPAAARFCDDPARVLIVQTAMAIAAMGAFGAPPRIRTASDPNRRPDPYIQERMRRR